MTFSHSKNQISRALNDRARELESLRNIKRPTAPTASEVGLRLICDDVSVMEWSRMHPYFRDLVIRTAAKLSPSSSEFEAKIAAIQASAELKLDGLISRISKKKT